MCITTAYSQEAGHVLRWLGKNNSWPQKIKKELNLPTLAVVPSSAPAFHLGRWNPRAGSVCWRAVIQCCLRRASRGAVRVPAARSEDASARSGRSCWWDESLVPTGRAAGRPPGERGCRTCAAPQPPARTPCLWGSRRRFAGCGRC